MRLTTHTRLASLLALGLSLPAIAQDDATTVEDAAPVAVEDAPAAVEETPPADDATAVAEPTVDTPAADTPEAPDAVDAAPVGKAEPAAPKHIKKAKASAPKAAVEPEKAREAAATPVGVAETGSAVAAGAVAGNDGAGSAVAASDTDTASAPSQTAGLAELEKRGAYDFISDGKRLELKDGDLSLEPPSGWEVYTKEPGMTFLAMPPKDPKFKYQRTIQVAAFDGPRYMDDITAKEYEEEIPRKFQGISNAIADYKVRNHLPVEMGDSRQGILFYTEFKLDNVPLMQAHIVVSSAQNHYLLTYTDIAEHFENDEQSQYLTEAWASLTSVQLKGRTPLRFTNAIMLGGGLVALLLLCLLVYVIRNWRAKRAYEFYGSGKGLDDVDIKSDMTPLIASKHPEGAPDSGASGMTFIDDEDDKRA